MSFFKSKAAGSKGPAPNATTPRPEAKKKPEQKPQPERPNSRLAASKPSNQKVSVGNPGSKSAADPSSASQNKLDPKTKQTTKDKGKAKVETANQTKTKNDAANRGQKSKRVAGPSKPDTNQSQVSWNSGARDAKQNAARSKVGGQPTDPPKPAVQGSARSLTIRPGSATGKLAYTQQPSKKRGYGAPTSESGPSTKPAIPQSIVRTPRTADALLAAFPKTFQQLKQVEATSTQERQNDIIMLQREFSGKVTTPYASYCDWKTTCDVMDWEEKAEFYQDPKAKVARVPSKYQTGISEDGTVLVAMELYRRRRETINWSRAVAAGLTIMRDSKKKRNFSLEKVGKIVFVNCVEEEYAIVAKRISQRYKQDTRYTELTPAKEEYKMMIATPFGKGTMHLLKENPAAFGAEPRVKRIMVDVDRETMIMEIAR